jgi:hypothetical protein
LCDPPFFILQSYYKPIELVQHKSGIIRVDRGEIFRSSARIPESRGGAGMKKRKVILLAVLLVLSLTLVSAASAEGISGTGTIWAKGAG